MTICSVVKPITLRIPINSILIRMVLTQLAHPWVLEAKFVHVKNQKATSGNLILDDWTEASCVRGLVLDSSQLYYCYFDYMTVIVILLLLYFDDYV